MKLINYSILAGQIYIYFGIFHLSRMVIIEIGFWFFLLDRFTPFKLIKMLKCANCVFSKMLYLPFQKSFCQIKRKMQMIIFVNPDYFIWAWSEYYNLLSHGGEKLRRQQGSLKIAEKFWIPQMTAFFDFKSQKQLLHLKCRSLKKVIHPP